jgi:broad specificity phosphatase PhoE
MVRHGQASFGSDQYDHLSEKGVEQSRILSDYLWNLELSFDAVYSGEMIRQKDTAYEMMAVYQQNGIPMPELKILSSFNEYNSKEIIMSFVAEVANRDPVLKKDLEKIFTDKKAFQRVFERAMAKWLSGEHQKPGMQTWDNFKKKVNDGLHSLMKENGRKKNIIIFTSGGPISAAMQIVLGTTDEQSLRFAWQIVNTSVTKFVYDEDRISLASFNSVSHLELQKDKSLITYR